MSLAAIPWDPAAPPDPMIELIESDGVPLESDWHRLAMTLLIELATFIMAGREDYFVGGNMFIYFNPKRKRNRDFLGPDFFFVRDVPLNPPRPYWAVWLEGGKFPNLIVELSSPTTATEDETTKKNRYEQVFRTPEYFICDLETKSIKGWRLVNGRYQQIQPNDKGWLWCEQFGLWLGMWEGKFQGKLDKYPRFFDVDGRLVPTKSEAESERAKAAEDRANAAETELARLRAKLANGTPRHESSNGG